MKTTTKIFKHGGVEVVIITTRRYWKQRAADLLRSTAEELAPMCVRDCGRPARGGNRLGSALCQTCYEDF